MPLRSSSEASRETVGVSVSEASSLPQARPPAGPTMSYAPALDGLRAVAVLAVMLYHGGVAVAGGGFLGVDMFFVLSGFLITTLLLLEWERDGRLDLVAFWGRRARRLLPALFLVLVGVLLYAAFLRGEAAAAVRADGPVPADPHLVTGHRGAVVPAASVGTRPPATEDQGP